MIQWTEQAARHLDQAHDYIALYNSPQVAARVAMQIISTVEQLEGFPMLGRAGRVPGSRELVIADTPFIVAYAIQKARIVILAIYHGVQRWPDAFCEPGAPPSPPRLRLRWESVHLTHPAACQELTKLHPNAARPNPCQPHFSPESAQASDSARTINRPPLRGYPLQIAILKVGQRVLARRRIGLVFRASALRRFTQG